MGLPFLGLENGCDGFFRHGFEEPVWCEMPLGYLFCAVFLNFDKKDGKSWYHLKDLHLL